MYIFLNIGDHENEKRFMSLIILKNVIRSRWNSFPEDVKGYIRQGVVYGLSNSLYILREYSGTTLSTILSAEGFSSWPYIIDTLLEKTKEETYLLGSFSCLEKICDDHQHELLYQASLPPLVDLFIQNLRNESEELRFYSLKSLLHLIPFRPAYLVENMKLFIESVFFLAEFDSSDKIQNQICQCFKVLVDSEIKEIIPHMPPIIEFMLSKTRSENDEVALSASDFWRYLCDYNVSPALIESRLSEILDALFEGVVITEEEYNNLEYEDEKEDSLLNSNNKSKKEKWSLKDSEDGENYEDWTKRKACASGIDSLAYLFPDEIIKIMLPKIEEKLGSNDWIQIEAALLTLGAISNGCRDKMYPYLDVIMPYLFHILENDNNTLLQCTDCWVLRRYSKWIVTSELGNGKYYKRYVTVMLNIIRNGTRQSLLDAALTALAVFIDFSGYDIHNYITDILNTIMTRYPTLTIKNLIIANDCLGTLSESIGEEIGKTEYFDIYMPVLINEWNQCQNDDPKLYYMMDLLSVLSLVVGDRLEPYAQLFLSRCFVIIEQYLQWKDQHVSNPDGVDLPDEDGFVSSLDLISGLLQGITESVNGLLNQSNFAAYIQKVLVHDMYESKNSLRCLFGVLGDVCRLNIDLIAGVLPSIIPKIVNYTVLRHNYPGLTNNAIWSMGEILLRKGDILTPQNIEQLLYNLMLIVDEKENYDNKSVKQNAIIALGEIGIFHAKTVAPYVERFYAPVCEEMRELEDDKYKENAFNGLYQILKANPAPLSNNLSAFLMVITSWIRPNERLRAAFEQVLLEIKQLFGANWETEYNKIPKREKEYIDTLYAI